MFSTTKQIDHSESCRSEMTSIELATPLGKLKRFKTFKYWLSPFTMSLSNFLFFFKILEIKLFPLYHFYFHARRSLPSPNFQTCMRACINLTRSDLFILTLNLESVMYSHDSPLLSRVITKKVMNLDFIPNETDVSYRAMHFGRPLG